MDVLLSIGFKPSKELDSLQIKCNKNVILDIYQYNEIKESCMPNDPKKDLSIFLRCDKGRRTKWIRGLRLMEYTEEELKEEMLNLMKNPKEYSFVENNKRYYGKTLYKQDFE